MHHGFFDCALLESGSFLRFNYDELSGYKHLCVGFHVKKKNLLGAEDLIHAWQVFYSQPLGELSGEFLWKISRSTFFGSCCM